MATYLITYNLNFTYKDKYLEDQTQEVEAQDEYNACTIAQYLLGGEALMEVTSIKQIK